MIDLELAYICSAVGGQLLQGEPSMLIRGVSTDSRRISPSSLFFAFCGENFDGHDFVINALLAGANAVCITRVVDGLADFPDKGIILVPDALTALQDLARSYRQKFSMPLVAITGSVGKTTTKDLVALCLEGRFNTLKSTGNYNNEIGLPLSLLQIDVGHEAVVVEMAMRQRGEIDLLTHIASPTCAVITNAEAVHMETLGSLENVARAKCEILAGLAPGSPAIINGDCPMLLEISRQYPVKSYFFGYNEDCHFRILSVTADRNGIWIEASLLGEISTVYCPIPARRLAGNVIAAVAAAILLGVELEICQEQLIKFQPTEKRLNIIYGLHGGIVINDTYNANPVSMAAALECGQELSSPGKWVAVLGDMFELGENEISGHLEVGQMAAASQVDLLVAVGKSAALIARGAKDSGLSDEKIHYFSSKKEALEFLKAALEPGDKVLFKASRGMQMETLIEGLPVFYE